MAKKKSTRSKSKTVNVGALLAGTASVGTLLAPVIQIDPITPLMQGNFKGAADRFLAGAQESIKPANIAKAAVPTLGFGLAKMGARALGVRAGFRIGKRTYKAF